MTELLFFLYFAVMTIVSSVLTVGLRSPVYCALALLSTLLHVAGLFVLLHAEFVAALQVIVYAGAVLVLYIFVIMLLDLKTVEKFLHKQVGIAIFFGVVLIFEILIGLFQSPLFSSAPKVIAQAEAPIGNTAEVGIALFTKYLLPFEIVGIILLGAVIGALVLAKKVPAS
ncbi:MAG: NADH-quinone oxidoreductase subunit J [Nitrospirae bacterium]|nr:NADH-quinone oxidoreductase subunit J [Candidatus Manganitrophaceae bacterium]